LSTFSFSGPACEGKIVTTVTDMVIFFAILCVHFALFVLIIFRTIGDISNSIVLNKGHHTGIYLLLLMVIVILIYQFAKRHVIKEMIEDLHEFDGKVIYYASQSNGISLTSIKF
jgi:uncharacterized membrane protein YagU involved in acid resistance